MDELIRAISADGYVSCAAVSSCDMIRRAATIHGASRTAAAALGRTLSASLMLAGALKNERASVTVRINGGGPVGTIIAVAEPDGTARCTAANPAADVPLRGDGKLDVGRLVGADGMLSVVRDMGSGEPYTGGVALVSGEIAEDLTQYLLVSEQQPSAVALGVLVGGDGDIRAGGGYIVSLLPGASDEDRDAIAERLERNIAAAGAVTTVLKTDHDPMSLVERVMDGFSPRVLERKPVFYRCGCSRERVTNALSGLGGDEVADIRDKNEPIEVTCGFCDAKYVFTVEEIVRINT